MRQAIQYLLEASVIGTLAFVFLMCCKSTLSKHCGFRFWNRVLFICASLFLFPLEPVKRLIYPISRPLSVLIQRFSEVFQIERPSVVTGTDDRVFPWLTVIWLIGFSIFVSVRVLSFVIASVRLRRGSRVAPVNMYDVFITRILPEKSLNRFGRLDRVCIYVNDDLHSPLTYGFFQKKIVLPGKMIGQYDSQELCLMFRHEAVHIKHGDSWKRLFTALIHAMHWFNPVFLLLTRVAREAIELYCDEETIGQDDKEARQQYGELLLAMASHQRRRSLAGIHMLGKDLTKKRIQSIVEPPSKTSNVKRVLFSSAFGLFLIACFIILTAFSTPANKREWEVADGGEISENGEWEYMHPGDRQHLLSDEGEYIFEQVLEPSVANYAPVPFETNSTNINLTLLSEQENVLVSLYYQTDSNYPLMQMNLTPKDRSQSFSLLSSRKLYLLSCSIEKESEDVVQIRITE